MRFKSLQFGKAMSAALFVLLLVVVGMTNALAQNQVATLQHEGNITMFYGADAFQNANNAAQNGDTITLSSGIFNGYFTITKPITIHGAGCVSDPISNTQPTIISGTITLDNTSSSSLTIKGIGSKNESLYLFYTSGCKNVVLSKCNIEAFNSTAPSYYQYYIDNLYLEDCIIKNTNRCYGTGIVIVNSVVRNYFIGTINSGNTIYNSILVLDNQPLSNYTAINSILCGIMGVNGATNSTFYNCIGINLSGGSSPFGEQLNNTNMEVTSYNDVFETFTGEITYDNSYQLKEEIANSFLGNDGTEVGIYGGMMPYNPRPSYMIIRRCNVAGRTTEDNKLSVEIELNTGE